MKRIAITAFILVSSVFVFTSCLDRDHRGTGEQAGTSDDNTVTLTTTDNAASDSAETTETQPVTDIETADSEETKPIIPEEPRDTLSEEEIKELRKNAEASLIKLDKSLVDEIEPLYEEEFGAKPIWADSPDSLVAGGRDSVRCYGEFNGCVVLLELTDLTCIEAKTIAGCEFTCESSFMLKCYKDGLFYDLQEGYEKGFITKEDTALAAERHKCVQDFIWESRLKK